MARTKGRVLPKRPSLLWIGDAVAHTGFSTVTHGVLDYLSGSWDTAVLGINYYGDPHKYKYPVYPASLGGDVWGVNRVRNMIRGLNPDVVMILNDPWVVKDYMPHVQGTGTKVAAYMPVDAKNIRSEFVTPLNDLSLAIAYTQFGLDQLVAGGLTTEATVIPHGFDPSIFTPMPRAKARQALQLPEDWFIVGCINRNQPRKRYDLLIEYFAAWAKDKPMSVRLYLHCALKDVGWDLIQLAQYHGVDDRLIITSPDLTAMNGVSREQMPAIYSAFDVHATTTAGEGWGLSVMEAMACGVPQIVPEWSALAEWPRGAVHYVECTSTAAHTGGINTVGGLADKQQFIAALDRMYTDEEYRKDMARRGRQLVSDPKYTWRAVGAAFDKALRKVISND